MSLNSPDSYLDIHDANLRIGGDVEAQAIKLAQIEIISNATTTSTVQFNNATKSFDAASNIEVGTANLFVDTTTSMVGIGTNAPAYTLDVNGDINFTGSFNQNGSAFVSTPWTIETGPSALSYTAGNVGIGAASPDARLHVTGNAYISSELTTNSNISAGYNQTTTSYFGKAAIGNDGYHTANAAFAHITKMGQNDYALKQNGSGRTDINSASGQDILFKNMDTEKAKITSTGNFVVNTDTLFVDATNSRVGIGTSSDPLSKLQIHEGDGEGTHRTLTWSSTRSDATKPLLGYLGTTASGAYASGGLGLFKNTLVGGTEDETVRIQANGDTWFNGGDVGIGTNNPGTTLDVNGTARNRKIAGWKSGTFDSTGVNMGPMADGTTDGPQIGWEYHVTFSASSAGSRVVVYGAYKHSGALYAASEKWTWRFREGYSSLDYSNYAELVNNSESAHASYYAIIRVVNCLYTNADVGNARHHFMSHSVGTYAGVGASIWQAQGYIDMGGESSGDRFNYLRITSSNGNIKGQWTAFPITT